MFFVALTALIALAARQSYLGLAIIGTLLALADSLEHVPEMVGKSVYRSGPLSVAFAVGLIVSGLVTAVVAYGAWRDSARESTGRRPFDADSGRT